LSTLADRLMALWSGPVPDGPAAEAAFAELYAPEFTLNGSPATPADLVAQARELAATYSDVRREVTDWIETPGRVAFAFVLHARHTGPLRTPLGVVAPTGRTVAIRVMDILTLTDGRITAVVAVPDQLGLLTQLNALRLAG
jgi:ketosteroid isomerase-like protein